MQNPFNKILIFLVISCVVCITSVTAGEKVLPMTGKEEQVLLEEFKDKEIDVSVDYYDTQQFFRTDLNNDGEDEYVRTYIGGSGRFFNILGIYEKKDNKFVDIYSEIHGYLNEKLEGALEIDGIFHGGILVEKENSKVYFSLIESHGKWYDSTLNNDRGGWVTELKPYKTIQGAYAI